eukprot:COSAG06_NODE_3671_length_5036_cov_3.267977_5_plen_85_part_00
MTESELEDGVPWDGVPVGGRRALGGGRAFVSQVAPSDGSAELPHRERPVLPVHPGLIPVHAVSPAVHLVDLDLLMPPNAPKSAN